MSGDHLHWADEALINLLNIEWDYLPTALGKSWPEFLNAYADIFEQIPERVSVEEAQSFLSQVRSLLARFPGGSELLAAQFKYLDYRAIPAPSDVPKDDSDIKLRNRLPQPIPTPPRPDRPDAQRG